VETGSLTGRGTKQRRATRWRLPAAGILAALVLALAVWWLVRPPAPGPLRLTKVTFADLPGWSGSDPRPALSAFRQSCAALADKAPSASMGGAGYAGTVADWLAPCGAAKGRTASDARAFFEHWFAPVAVSAGAVQDGRFTGYYEPQIHASRTRHGAYRVPVYGVPSDLVSVDLGAFRPALRGERIAGRLDGHALVPYATRAEIDAQGLRRAPILFYANDDVAVFFLHIQGSGRVIFDDGHVARISYAAQNGQVYTPIGRTLVARGLPREGLSLQTIRAWLKAHPGEARQVMETDASYVFFKEEPIGDPALGAKGAEGVPLTPGASLAVDPRWHALGTPFFLATELPGGAPSRSLFVAQDIGGAIRGPVRGDIFFGFGREAELLAGGMNHDGRLFVLLPKPVAQRLAPQTDYPGVAS
jgi:peptidoglycan lytic transglycosylase A